MYQKSQPYNIQFLKYRVRQAEFFVILVIFCPSNTPSLMFPKIKILIKKWKKCLQILSFYIYMCTINEDHEIYDPWNIRCDRQKFLSFSAIFCPFSPLTSWKIKILKLKKKNTERYHHFTNLHHNDNHMMHGSWDMECNRQNFFSFWTVFCPSMPLWTQKIKIFKKRKKHLKILSFYKCVP